MLKKKKKMARGKTILDVNVSDVEKRRHPSKHYVYIITVSWSDGTVNVIYRRYSRFFDFQVKLLESFEHDAGKTNPQDRIIPFLPGKIIFGRSHIREVALKRLDPINKYCKELIRLPSHISECQLVTYFFEPTVEDLAPPKARSAAQTPAKVSDISGPVLLDQYTVLIDYKKEGANEISLHAGEILDVIEKNETGWWFVSGEEGQGWVPSSYLELGDGATEDSMAVDAVQDDKDHPYLATQTYTPQLPDEVFLERGAMVDILQKNLDGWWRVRCAGKEGLVPGNYLTKTDTIRGKRIREAINNQGGATTSISNGNSSISSSDDEDDFVDVGQEVKLRHGNNKPLDKRLQNNPLIQIPFKPHKAKNDQATANPVRTRKNRNTARKVAEATATVDQSPLVNRKPPPPRRQSVKQMSLKRLNSLHPPEPEEEPIYMTTSDYDNHVGDGISFSKDSKVQVLDKHETGWWYITIDSETGWAPSQYIEKRLPGATKAKETTSKSPRPAAKLPTEAHKPASSKPLPALPTSSRTAPANDSFSSDDEPVYANEDPQPPEPKVKDAPPPLPAKNPVGWQGRKSPVSHKPETFSNSQPSANAQRQPVTSPRTNRENPSTDFTSELASKFGGLRTAPNSSGSANSTKPQLPAKKDQAQPMKPKFPAKVASTNQVGNGKPQVSASSTKPQLPASKPMSRSPQPLPRDTQASSNNNIQAMKNLFEGRS